MVPQPDRSVPPRRAGTRRAPPVRRGRPAHADPPALVRPDGTAADARGSGGLRRRSLARRLRAPGRSDAGEPPIRRAMGPALARPRPLCRDRRPRIRLRHPERLRLSRLCHPRPQCRRALRPIPRRATRRRPARVPASASVGAVQRIDHRHRIPLSRRGDALAGRRPRGGGAPGRQPDRRDGEGVPRPDRRLRPLPRSQVRPDREPRLLRPRRLFPQLSIPAGVHRPSRPDRRAAPPPGRRPRGHRRDNRASRRGRRPINSAGQGR